MARLLLPLMLFALLLAPVRMLGHGEAAAAPAHAAHHAAAMAHHHHRDSAPQDEPAAPKADCMTACAAIAPPAGAPVAEPEAAPSLHYLAPAATASGLAPEAEPPPPRP